MQWRLDAGGLPDLPPLHPTFRHFIDWLFEAGPTSAAGMGQIALTWPDLRAWQAGLGVSLPPWQLRMLRRMSAEYLAEAQTADAHDAPPPWERGVDREKIAKHIRSVLRG